MTLPASGTLTFANIANELGEPFPITVPKNSWTSLAGKASGSLVFPTDYHGKSRMQLVHSATVDTVGGVATFAGVSFGESGVAAADGRRIFCTVSWHGATANEALFTSATIGGVAAVADADLSRSSVPDALNIGTGMLRAFPTVDSGTVAITFNQTDVRTVRIDVYRCINAEVVTAKAENGTMSSGVQSIGLIAPNGVIDVVGGSADGGCLLLAGITLMTGGAVGNITVTGVSEDIEITNGNARMVSAMQYQLPTESNRLVGITNTVPAGQTGLFSYSVMSIQNSEL